MARRPRYHPQKRETDLKMSESTVDNNLVLPNEQKVEPGKTPDTWKIIGGEGLEVVGRRGWKEYRDELERLSWMPIANTQIEEIKRLLENAKSEPPLQISPSEAIATRDKIIQYADESVQRYPKEGLKPYYAVKDGKKLYFDGKEIPAFGREKTTRIYMALREGAFTFGMEALREQLTANGAIDKMSLVLNLEAIQGDNPNGADNNAIVMYIPDSNPDILTKISEAITKAKQKNPKVFELTSGQLANAKSESIAEFMVPLDDTTWFVEVEPQQKGGTESYHQGVFAEMRSSVYRGYSIMEDGLPNIAVYKETLNARRPEIRSIAPIIDHYSGKPLPRRLAMPGLVIQK